MLSSVSSADIFNTFGDRLDQKIIECLRNPPLYPEQLMLDAAYRMEQLLKENEQLKKLIVEQKNV